MTVRKLCISNETKGFNKVGILGERLSHSLQLNFESTVNFKGQVLENTKWWEMLLHFPPPPSICMMYAYIYFWVSSFNVALQSPSLYVLTLSIVLQWYRDTDITTSYTTINYGSSEQQVQIRQNRTSTKMTAGVPMKVVLAGTIQQPKY